MDSRVPTRIFQRLLSFPRRIRSACSRSAIRSARLHPPHGACRLARDVGVFGKKRDGGLSAFACAARLTYSGLSASCGSWGCNIGHLLQTFIWQVPDRPPKRQECVAWLRRRSSPFEAADAGPRRRNRSCRLSQRSDTLHATCRFCSTTSSTPAGYRTSPR